MFSLTTPAVQGTRDTFSLMDALFSDWLTTRPAPSLVSSARIDVTESDGSYQVRAELPGATKDDITIDIVGSRVSLTAKTNSQSEKKDGAKVIYSERSSESYARTFELPQSVDSAEAIAKFENGVLTLTLPKKNAPQSRRVAIG